MESLLGASSATYLLPSIGKSQGASALASNRNPCLKIATEPHFPGLVFEKQQLFPRFRKSLIVEAKGNRNKVDKHSFVSRPDEATGPFPEAVLLREKNNKKDGKLVPEFEDAEEEKLFEYLQLQIERDLKTDRMRHYEVVYLIHEKHVDEVGNVKEKIQEFLRERKGKVWRLNDWGLRRLAYKIKKATKAYYVLMNFELDAKWVNDFKGLLDSDERVIRHLVMKRDEAETKDCPPPPEWHALRSATFPNDDDDNDDIDSEDKFGDEGLEDGDGVMNMDGYDDDDVDGEDDIIVVDVNVEEDEDEDDDDLNGRQNSPSGVEVW